MNFKRLFSVAVVASTLGSAPVAAQAFTGPVAANAYINYGGLDWAWASPCNFDCSVMVLVYGFRFATAAEFASRPSASAFLDALGNRAPVYGYPQMRCAAGWFDMTYDHCDYNQYNGGYATQAASGPGVGAPSGGYQETLVVRDQVVTTPEPASFILLGSGLLAVVGITRRRRNAA